MNAKWKNKLACAAAILAFGSAAAMADCEAPETPEVPDGATASMDDMLAGQKAVKSFQTANVEYMKCLEGVFTEAEATVKNAGEDASEEDIAAAQKAYSDAVEAYNAAVSNEESVAGQFNTEIREFKAANPG